MDINPAFWRGRRVFITGHTGFKGSWLALWLSSCGAQVHGYATSPPTKPNLFSAARIEDLLTSHTVSDVRDADALRSAMAAAAPQIVLHLAAQPLVRYSYAEPVETYAVNVLGTVHLLEAVRACPGVTAVVNVTTDKCYENREWIWGYRESESLGGHDPYSSSKACSELVTSAYRDSFFRSAGVMLASARAGNVIGGGDWARDRLVPDFFRALDDRRSLEIRFPDAIRPWQHVLEPLCGYLMLAEQLASHGDRRTGAWNFGPSDEDAWPVRRILDHLVSRAPGAAWHQAGGERVHEAGLLKLDSSKARTELGWRPRWTLARALDRTIEWHQAWRAGRDVREVCLAQISSYRDGSD